MQSNAARWGNLFLMVAILFGGFVRFAPTALAGVPINDGGMFYTMIQELRSNGFVLPAFTSYNQLGIPFAYPPLALYAGAVLGALGVPTMEVLRWLPAAVSTASILAFYWMAAQMLASRSKGAMAAAFYALMPRSMSWYVMGGGLSRSFGILFLLLTCGAAWMMFSRSTWRRILLTIVCGAAAVLSHPETALHIAAACVLIGLLRGRTARGARDAALVAAGVAVLSSPWWGSVIAQHGPGAFASAVQTGRSGGSLIITWLTFNFAQEPFVAVLTAIGLTGLAVQCIRHEWFLPLWTLVPFVIEPRSAPAIAVLPLAMLGSVGLTEFIVSKVAALKSAIETNAGDWTHYLDLSAAARIVSGAVLAYAFFGAFAYDLSLAGLVVAPESRAAMQWAQANTPADSRFMVLTGSNDPFSDATAEWFPTLAQRSSVSTLQGREWLLGRDFMPFLDDLGNLEGCLSGGPECVVSWARRYNSEFGYIYVQGPPEQSPTGSVLLAYELKRDPQYELVYDEGGVVIFARK